MKILFVNLPYYGHVVPTIGLVQELIAQGCEVIYLMPFGWESVVAESGAIFAGYPNHKQLSEQIKHAYAVAEQIVEGFDMVVYEQFFFLGKHLAQRHHKPAVRIFTAPATDKRLMQEYLAADGSLGVFRYKWVARAWTKDIIKDIGEELPMRTDNWLDEIVENPPELNLVYTLREYQPHVAAFPETQYKFLGPSVYVRNSEKIAFAKGERPVIYISLGTIVKGAKKFFRHCIDAFEDQPVDVVISAGEAVDSSVWKQAPPNIHVFASVPQTEVLQYADLFVTHGGMNSISEALVYGVPMVVIPFIADQPTNAKRVETLGLGRHLEYRKINSRLLRDAALSVLNDDAIKDNLAKAQGWIAQAPGNKGGADMLLEYYRDWKECV